MRFLIIIALILSSFIIFYNAFYIPEANSPAIVYIDKEKYHENNNIDNIQEVQEVQEETLNKNTHEEYIVNNNNNKININQSSIQELTKIPGIGPVTAQKIIDYRVKNGLFKEISEIKNIKGIGEKKFERIKDYLVV